MATLPPDILSRIGHEYRKRVEQIGGVAQYMPTDPRASSEYLVHMIASRMRANVNPSSMGVDWMAAWEGKDKVSVFVVVNDKPIILEDDLALFPSDALITQLRVIAKA